MKRVIIDTDPGIDDAAAILMALGSSELKVEAITTVFGNTPVENCTLNALRILEAAGHPDVPVYQGAGRPFSFAEPQFAAQVHGDDGLGNAGLPLPELKPQSRNAILELIDRLTQSPGEISVLCIGRLTNLALAISVEPRVASAVREVIVMGGAVTVPGNASSVAGANLWGDPEAADVVYRSGAKVVQIGLDVCDRVEFTPEQQERVWRANTPATRLLKAVTPFIQRVYARRGRLKTPGGVRYNDVPAIAYSIDPSLFDCRELYVQIETQGVLTRGQTVADLYGYTGRQPNAMVALDVDLARLTEMWVEQVGSLKPY
jgi:inosine-uridine nucleoside N-ribohydrolase